MAHSDRSPRRAFSMTLKPEPFRIQVASLEALSALAEAMAQAMPGDAFVTLEGDLGAGKTTFVKALAAAAGIDPSEVISPTFGLVHLHSLPGGGPARRLLHADLYRLSGPAELAEIGWDDAVAAPGWVLVEWPDRAGNTLPADRLEIEIQIDSETGRTFLLTPHGPIHEQLVGRVRERV